MQFLHLSISLSVVTAIMIFVIVLAFPFKMKNLPLMKRKQFIALQFSWDIFFSFYTPVFDKVFANYSFTF